MVKVWLNIRRPKIALSRMYTRRETKRERKTEIDRQRCLSWKNINCRLMVEGSMVGWLPVRTKILSVGVEWRVFVFGSTGK